MPKVLTYFLVSIIRCSRCTIPPWTKPASTTSLICCCSLLLFAFFLGSYRRDVSLEMMIKTHMTTYQVKLFHVSISVWQCCDKNVYLHKTDDAPIHPAALFARAWHDPIVQQCSSRCIKVDHHVVSENDPMSNDNSCRESLIKQPCRQTWSTPKVQI